VEGSFKLHPVLVPASDAADLRSFLVDVERHLQRLLEVP
jgi:hypothetical protein